MIYNDTRDPFLVLGEAIYNDLNHDVELSYLGSAFDPVMDEKFVMKPNEIVVIEKNAIVRKIV